jgi:hypothetical protein
MYQLLLKGDKLPIYNNCHEALGPKRYYPRLFNKKLTNGKHEIHFQLQTCTEMTPHSKNPEIGNLSFFRITTPNLVSKVLPVYCTQFLINEDKKGFSLHPLIHLLMRAMSYLGVGRRCRAFEPAMAVQACRHEFERDDCFDRLKDVNRKP